LIIFYNIHKKFYTEIFIGLLNQSRKQMLTDKVRIANLLHKELGVSYFQLLKEYLTKDNTVTIHIKGLSINMDFGRAYQYAKTLRNIENHGWEIVDTINNLVVYENKQNGIKLYSRITDTFPYSGVIEEVFVQEVYKSDFANKVVIDVGAYLGESAIYFALQGAKKVIALEPDEENYKLALMNIRENNLENKTMLLNKALASNNSTINFYKYINSPYINSIDPNNMVRLDDKLVVKQVEATTLNQLLKIAGERVGLLKLDCEGCEYSVLNSFSDFDMIDNIVLEYHNGFQNLPSLLKENGYEIKIEKNNEKGGILRAFKK